MATGLTGPLSALLSSVTWAVGSAAYSRFSHNYSAFAVNFSRALVAFPCFILLTFAFSGGWAEAVANFSAVTPAHFGWFLLSIFASYGFGDALFLWSARSLGVPGALAIGSIYPAWTVLAGYFWFSQELSKTQLLALGITITAVVIVAWNSPSQGKARFSKKGLLLALGASLAWATNSLAASRGGADIMPTVANSIRMGMALIVSSSLSRVFAPKTAFSLPLPLIFKWGWLFLFEAVLGSFLFLYGISHSPLALGTTLSSLSPVIAVPIALFFRLEEFSLYRVLGVVMAVTGVCLLLTTF